MTGNREYKSDTFSLLMQIPEYALEVYNSLNHTDYSDWDKIIYQQLDHSFSLTVQNDASFIIDSYFNLYEHQTTYNPNMPLRSLIYFSDYARDFIKNRDIYSNRLVKIPTPKFAVFYNGDRRLPEQQLLYLSDAFEQPMEAPDLELICTVYNINKGFNRDLLKRCPVLRKYMIFTRRVKYHVRKMEQQCASDDHWSLLTEKGKQALGIAINMAIDECIAYGILREFFQEHRAEVEKTMVLDYTYERRMELNRQEGYEEGAQTGFSQGISQGIVQGISRGLVSLVHTLRNFLSTPEDIWQQVIRNPDYKDVTLNQVKELMMSDNRIG